MMSSIRVNLPNMVEETELGLVRLEDGRIRLDPVWGGEPVDAELGAYRVGFCPKGVYVLGLGADLRVYAQWLEPEIIDGVDGGVVRTPWMIGALHHDSRSVRHIGSRYHAYGETIRIWDGLMSLAERDDLQFESHVVGAWQRSQDGDTDILVRVSVGTTSPPRRGTRWAWAGGLITCHTNAGGHVVWHWGVLGPQGEGDDLTNEYAGEKPEIMVFSSRPSPRAGEQISAYLHELPWEITASLMDRIIAELAKRAL